MNSQSIKNKKPELQTIVDPAKSANLGSLRTVLTRKFFQKALMQSGRIGLVMPMGESLFVFEKDLSCTEVPEPETDCELVWIKLLIV